MTDGQGSGVVEYLNTSLYFSDIETGSGFFFFFCAPINYDFAFQEKNSFFYSTLLIGYLIRNSPSFRCWEAKSVSGFKKSQAPSCCLFESYEGHNKT